MSSVESNVIARIQQEQRQEREIDRAQSVRIAKLNPALRANLAKQGITGRVGTINVQQPSISFGKRGSTAAQVSQRIVQLRESRVRDPGFTFGSSFKTNRIQQVQSGRGQTGDFIKQRLAAVAPPSRKQQGLPPKSSLSQTRVIGRSPAAKAADFIGPPTRPAATQSTPTISTPRTQSQLIGEPTVRGISNVPRDFINILPEPVKEVGRGVRASAQNIFADLVDVERGGGKAFAQVFAPSSLTARGKVKESPRVATGSRIAEEALVKGAVDAAQGRPVSFEETNQQVLQRFTDRPFFESAAFATDLGALLAPVGIGAVGRGARAVSIGTKVTKTTTKTTKSTAQQRKRDFELSGEGKTVTDPTKSPFGTATGTSTKVKVKPSKAGSVTTRAEQSSAIETRRAIDAERFFTKQGTTNKFFQVGGDKPFKVPRGVQSTGKSGQQSVLKLVNPKNLPTVRQGTLPAFRGPRLPKRPKSKKGGASAGAVTGAVIGATAILQIPRTDQAVGITPSQASKSDTKTNQIIKQSNIFGNQQRFRQAQKQRRASALRQPRLLAAPVTLVPRTTTREGFGLLQNRPLGANLKFPSPPDLQRGSNFPFNESVRGGSQRFFTVFDTSLRPFGRTKIALGVQQQSLSPNFEIRRTGRARGKGRGKKGANLQERFFNI